MGNGNEARLGYGHGNVPEQDEKHDRTPKWASLP
jgi:hypothetical protein